MSDALVADAGTAEVNGTHTERGTSGGKPYYNLEGNPDDVNSLAVVWFEDVWWIRDSSGSDMYKAEEDVAFPWLASSWVTELGDEPPPTVTEVGGGAAIPVLMNQYRQRRA